jgi:hypothetical protein
MKKIKLFYNANCGHCARLAERTRKLDWFNNVDLSTETPPSGALPPGEIAVLQYQSGQYHSGPDATRQVCMQIPLYMPYALLLRVPMIKRLIAGNRH